MERRVFFRDLTGTLFAMWSVARAVRAVDRAPPDPPLEAQVDARFTAIRHGEPRSPSHVAFSVDGRRWVAVRSIRDAHQWGIRASRPTEKGIRAPGCYAVRALEPRSHGADSWVMFCRNGAVVGWAKRWNHPDDAPVFEYVPQVRDWLGGA